MMRLIWRCGVAAITIAGPVPVCTAFASPVVLTVRYPASGPGVAITSEPALPFRCAPSHGSVVCSATVPRGTALQLRARTRPPAGSASVSAMSLPIDGKAWRGACASTAADVCRLRVMRAVNVRIDTREP